MDELGIVAGAIEHAVTADGRAFFNRERQMGLQREGAVDADSNDAASAIVGFMKREARGQDDTAGGASVLFADQATAAVIGLPLCRGRNYAE